jgi:hypothetical protein
MLRIRRIVGSANAVSGLSKMSVGTITVATGSGLVASTPVTGPIGAVTGGAAEVLGVVQMAQGLAKLSRGVKQMDEAFSEPFDAASFRNLLGLLPAGQKFDDPCEPTIGEYLQRLRDKFISHPIEAAKQAVKDYFAL